MVMNTSRAVLSLGTWIGTTQRLSRFLSAAGFAADSFASKFMLLVEVIRCFRRPF